MQSPFEKGRRIKVVGPLFADRPVLHEESPAKPVQMRECTACHAPHAEEGWRESLDVCPSCGRHERMPARWRAEITADPGTFEELKLPEVIHDPLGFPGYEQKLQKNKAASGLEDGLLAGVASVGGHRTVLGVMDPVFLMGSMGAKVGEGIAFLTDEAIQRKLPLIIFCCSGGARMQEGMVSLMQMAKASMSVGRLAVHKLPYITVLTDPTSGGVTASFAMLGDIILAEPGAYICFTGMRVIQQTLRQELPEGFQLAEFLLEHGFIDIIVHRREMAQTLASILKMHGF